jgi:hypothetical protein
MIGTFFFFLTLLLIKKITESLQHLINTSVLNGDLLLKLQHQFVNYNFKVILFVYINC